MKMIYDSENSFYIEDWKVEGTALGPHDPNRSYYIYMPFRI